MRPFAAAPNWVHYDILEDVSPGISTIWRVIRLCQGEFMWTTCHQFTNLRNPDLRPFWDSQNGTAITNLGWCQMMTLHEMLHGVILSRRTGRGGLLSATSESSGCSRQGMGAVERDPSVEICTKTETLGIIGSIWWQWQWQYGNSNQAQTQNL